MAMGDDKKRDDDDDYIEVTTMILMIRSTSRASPETPSPKY